MAKGKFASYVQAQKRCTKQAPTMKMSFHALVPQKNSHVVFRDVTPFFAALDVLEPANSSGVILIRPRRWGKSVLGTAWIEFLRGRADLFVGTWAETRMRKEKLIGIHLDMSVGGTSLGGCTEGIMNAINKGIELAEKEEGYRAAKGRRVSIETPTTHLGIEKFVTDWTLSDCIALVGRFLVDLESIATAAGLQVAMFVDEYDLPCRKALMKPNFEDFNKFFQEFYTKIKAESFIPFLFVTGSSRLSLNVLANNITDLSYESVAATALGYVWDDIEKLYGEQLVLLEKLHGLDREGLRVKMEAWYGNVRWSKTSSVCVFNPYSVNEFMRTGEFHAHWTETGGSSPLFNKKLFRGDFLRLLLVENARVELSLRDLTGVKFLRRLQGNLTREGQWSVLASSGVITIARDFDWRGGARIPLVIPNLDSRTQAEQILHTTFEPFMTQSVREAVRDYYRNGNPVALLATLDGCGELAKLALKLAGNDQVIEKYIHQAITILVFVERSGQLPFEMCSKLSVEKSDVLPKWLDLAFWVHRQDVGYRIMFKCSDSSTSVGLRRMLQEGLEQLREKCTTFHIPNAEFSQRRYACVVFGKDAKLLAFTKPLSFEEISEVQDKLTAEKNGNWKENDSRVVLKERSRAGNLFVPRNKTEKSFL